MSNFIVAGNWKLNKTPKETEVFLIEFLESLSSDEQKNFMLFPPAISLLTAQCMLCGDDSSNPRTHIGWGAQNICFENSGAFTGENSAEMIKSMGATHVLVGHSERRHVFGESDKEIAQKVKLAIETGLTPILCIGETLAQREAGETNAVNTNQLKAGLSLAMSINPGDESKTHRVSDNLIVAYEPVWAIGTGQVASPEQAEEAHEHIRKMLTLNFTEEQAKKIPILYGGSVKPANAAELAKQPNIDGFLVGGASLDPESFKAIYDNAVYQ